MFAILVDENAAGIDRETLVDQLRALNVGTSVHYIPTHAFTAYRSLPTVPLPQTDAIAKRILSLPLYPEMTDDDVADVTEAIRSILAGRPATAAASSAI
jgi:UDP-4-amino-4-deoxy-L-arabinose-oxoglutarate aminotransferase